MSSESPDLKYQSELMWWLRNVGGCFLVFSVIIYALGGLAVLGMFTVRSCELLHGVLWGAP